jgi:predicted Zn-dependent protease
MFAMGRSKRPLEPRDKGIELDMSRREQIEKMLSESPNDLFLNFALAMEFAKEKCVEEAVAQFDRVLEIDPQHVPAYLQQARTMIDGGRNDDAREILNRGIGVARDIGDSHAADEMSDLLKMM